ncbi:MAG: hypothetical protein H7125_08425 [Proteobacteria bacterium]|nr:hypothetical protein [Burkholderiales bacterium]
MFGKIAASLFLSSSVLCASAQAATLLYQQNFEAPVGFVNDGGDFNISRTVNQNYANQPAGFTFAQNFTVENLLIGGTQAFGQGYKDPQGIGGSYVLGLLSSAQNDLLGLSFNVGAFRFLNFQLDISSIDLDRQGGPFVPAGGAAPTFRFSLFDNPGGGSGVGGGTLLDSFDASGTVAPNKFTFDWTNVIAPLDATGNTNGNVILQIDLLSGGYAAMDNFVIAASDLAGEVPGRVIPLPPGFALMLGGLFLIGGAARKVRR